MCEMLRTTGTGRQMLRTATRTLGASIVAALIGFAGGLGVAQTTSTLDPTFGTGGIVTTSPTLIGGNPNAPGGGTTGTLTAIKQPNGDIPVVTGINLTEFSNPFFRLVRYTSDGTLIGATSASFAGSSSPGAVAVESNGDITVAGMATAASDDGATSFAAARFTANGQMDRTFGTGGLVLTTPAGVSPLASAPLVQPNGQILMGGPMSRVSRNASGETVLVRYNSSGSLDTTLGAGGIAKAVSAVASPAALAQRSNDSRLAVSGGTSVEFSSTGVLTSKSWWGASLTLSARRQAD